MSRTDKDVPYRIHSARGGIEEHDHRLGDCDLDEWTPDRYWIVRDRTRCRITFRGSHRYWNVLRCYPRTKRVEFYADSIRNGDNARVRAHVREIAKLHRAGEDVEFEDVPNYQHRHSAEWEAW